MKIILRKEAKSLKLKRYFTGKACKHGHIFERETTSGQCITCRNLATQRRRKENKEEYKKQKYVWDKTYREVHDSVLKAKKHEYYERNKERLKAKSKEYSKNNKEEIAKKKKIYADGRKEIKAAYDKEYRKNNKHKLSKHSIQRNYKRYQATPPWYTDEKIKINRLYSKRDELSKLWDIQLHVDHIVPIQGENVCGLHCWDNLQLLESSLNLVKGNRFKE